ncbi:MAG TPA: hypothetical protein VLZ06_06625, partial [Solirubrobacteraceae bacterium]|nr:hypothetical protein [Solirubrobacteraceae bacterium]
MARLMLHLDRADEAPVMRRAILIAATLALGLAGCGSSSHSASGTSGGSAGGSAATHATQVSLNPVQRAAVAFTKNAGTAFTTFDRAIYVPYQHGAFKSSKPNPAVLASAGQTARVVASEIHAATV